MKVSSLLPAARLQAFAQLFEHLFVVVVLAFALLQEGLRGGVLAEAQQAEGRADAHVEHLVLVL